MHPDLVFGTVLSTVCDLTNRLIDQTPAHPLVRELSSKDLVI